MFGWHALICIKVNCILNCMQIISVYFSKWKGMFLWSFLQIIIQPSSSPRTLLEPNSPTSSLGIPVQGWTSLKISLTFKALHFWCLPDDWLQELYSNPRRCFQHFDWNIVNDGRYDFNATRQAIVSNDGLYMDVLLDCQKLRVEASWLSNLRKSSGNTTLPERELERAHEETLSHLYWTINVINLIGTLIRG